MGGAAKAGTVLIGFPLVLLLALSTCSGALGAGQGSATGMSHPPPPASTTCDPRTYPATHVTQAQVTVLQRDRARLTALGVSAHTLQEAAWAMNTATGTSRTVRDQTLAVANVLNTLTSTTARTQAQVTTTTRTLLTRLDQNADRHTVPVETLLPNGDVLAGRLLGGGISWRRAVSVAAALLGTTSTPAAPPPRRYQLGPVLPGTQLVADHIGPKFQVNEIHGWREVDPWGFPDHVEGWALDFMTYQDYAKGDQIVAYLQEHAEQLGVKYLIFRQRSWNVRSKTWRDMADRGTPTANHVDHVHVSFIQERVASSDIILPTTAAATPTSSAALPTPGTPRRNSLHNPALPVPEPMKTLYTTTGQRFGIPWTLLAGIGMIETGHGRIRGTDPAGATGLMAFLPSAWTDYGIDGDGDGTADRASDADSVASAGNLLSKIGATKGPDQLRKALRQYGGGVDWYVNDVLWYAHQYGGGTLPTTATSMECAWATAQPTPPGATPSAAPTAGAPSPPPAAGGWILPVNGRFTSPFGYRIHPILHIRKFHSGIDLAAPCHTPIRAANNGVVHAAGYRSASCGWAVELDHANNVSTLYCHMPADDIDVTPGQSIAAGTVLGGVGTTGRSTGCHLHLGLTINHQFVDPASYLRAAGVHIP